MTSRFIPFLQREFSCLTMIIVFGIICIPISAFGQKNLIDSLHQKIVTLEMQENFSPKNTDYIDLLFKISRSYIYHNHDSLRYYGKKAIELSEEINYQKGIAGGNLSVGEYHILNAEFEKGFELVTKAENLASAVGADTIQLRSLNSNAMGHFMKGDFPNAYLLCKKGEEEAERTRNQQMQALFAMNLATCFSILKDYEQAQPYYQKALTVLENYEDEELKAEVLSNLGYLNLQTGNLENAKVYSKEAIKTFQAINFYSWEAFGWTTLGEVYIKEKKFSDALESFEASTKLLENVRDNQRIAENEIGYAKVYFELNDLDESYKHAKKAKTAASEIDYHQGIVNAAKLIYRITSKQNNTVEALENLQLANHLSDSILESENKTRFLLLETQNQHKINKERLKLESEKELSLRNIILIFSIGILIALALLFYLVNKNARNQKKAFSKLKESNFTKDRIFSIIGKDLKAPINTLQEILEHYKNVNISEEDIHSMTPKLKENVELNSFMLNNLLLWAKIQMNGLPNNPSEINVLKLLNEVCDSFSTLNREKKQLCRKQVEEDIIVYGDKENLRTIFKNLISNALKFSPINSTIKFSSFEEENQTYITISNSGPVIPFKTLEAIENGQIVEPDLGTNDEKGTGIGLHLTKALVELNKGSINIKSDDENGTMVTLKFPKSQ